MTWGDIGLERIGPLSKVGNRVILFRARGASGLVRLGPKV